MNTSRVFLVVLLAAVMTAPAAVSQETVHWDVVSKIRGEGFQHSQVMDLAGYMSDVLGPRLTGSPGMRKAQKWAQARMKELGLENVVIEKATAHGASWDNEYTSLHMIEPDYQPLIGYAKAFTPGSNGKIRAEAAVVQIATESDMAQYRGKLKGKIVLYAPEYRIGFRFTPDATRLSEEDLLGLERTPVLAESPQPTVTVPQDEYQKLQKGEIPPKPVEFKELTRFFKSEGVVMLVDVGSGRGDYGTVLVGGRSDSRADRSYQGVLDALPEVTLASEHYNRIYRILKRGIPVVLEMEIRNYLSGSDPDCYNVIGEIPGTDLRDEIVIIGGHFDSWHAGTGAVDDASGCAVALEAARILKAIGARPRRTIRVAFWTYEEGGLVGSRSYVEKHFGNPADGKLPEYDKLSGYFNMDNGSGRFRGVNLQGNEGVRPTFQAWMEPFRDLGMDTLSSRSVGGTDHLSFDRAGLPGWQFIQDRLDYRPIRHHTNMDVYDGLDPEDMMINAVVMASFAYHAAMRDQKLPRKPYTTPAR
jgi:carboxypeptidase Q